MNVKAKALAALRALPRYKLIGCDTGRSTSVSVANVAELRGRRMLVLMIDEWLPTKTVTGP